MRAGQKFSRTMLAEDREKLSTYYKDQGYAYANVMPLTKVDLRQAADRPDLRGRARQARLLRAHQHPRQLQDPRQGDPPRDEDLRGRALQPHEPRDLASAGSWRSGFFENVVVSTKRGSSDEFVEVNVEVTERPTGTFQIGAGFSSVENFIAQAQISQNNLFGRGQTLALQAQISSLRQLFSLRFVEPYFLDTQWTFAFDLYNQSRGFGTFYRNASGGTLTWGYPLSYEARALPHLQARGRQHHHRLGRHRQPRRHLGADRRRRRSPTCSAAASRPRCARSLSWDSRNNRLFPTGGWYHTAVRRVREPVHRLREQVRALGRVRAPLPPAVGAVRLSRQRRDRRSRRRPIRSACRSASATSSAASTISAATRRARSVPSCSRSRPATSASRSAACRSAATCSSSSTARSSSRCSRRSASRASCSSTWATPTTSRIATARACSARTRRSRSSSTRASGSRVAHRRASASRSALGSAGISPIGPLRFEWGIPLDAQLDEDPLVFEFTIGNFF